MESALFPLRQVNGLVAFARTARPPISGSRKAGLTNHAIMHSSCNLMGIIKLRRGKALREKRMEFLRITPKSIVDLPMLRINFVPSVFAQKYNEGCIGHLNRAQRC